MNPAQTPGPSGEGRGKQRSVGCNSVLSIQSLQEWTPITKIELAHENCFEANTSNLKKKKNAAKSIKGNETVACNITIKKYTEEKEKAINGDVGMGRLPVTFPFPRFSKIVKCFAIFVKI